MTAGDAPGDITEILLSGAQEGLVSRSSADRVFSAAYDELRKVAQREMNRNRPAHTLQPTALLNEVYIRLIDQSRIRWDGRAHFFGIAVRAMRQVLVDHARRRDSKKRGGSWQRVEFDERVALTDGHEVDILDLERALTKLAGLNERMARVVELRIFADLTAEEVGAALGVSRKTVTQDWRFAIMWLRAMLAGEEGL